MACLDENTVAELLDGVLDDRVRAGVEDHLDACARCRALVGSVAAGGLASGTVAATSPLSTAVVERGSAVGRYVVLGRIGAGSMGVVYAAYDPELDRKVALKLLSAPAASGDEVRERLLREAQSMARLSHPNIVTIHDVLDDQGCCVIAMEYIAGDELRKWLEADHSPDEILDKFLQAGEGVAAAHRAGVVHRDFKPENVLVSEDGRVRVTDFGLAALHSLTTGTGAATVDESNAEHVVGTPRYMAPEQRRGEGADPRSDQFSFCVALFEALDGSPPFAGDTVVSYAAAAGAGEIREPTRRLRVSAAVRRAIVRGLAPDPDDRYAEMAQLLADLRSDGPRKRWRVTAAALGAAGLLGGGLLIGRGEDDPCPRVQLDDVWNASARAALASAVEGWPDRDELVDRASAEIEAYAAAWTSAHEDACRATRVRRTQSPAVLEQRMACLEDRRLQLRALVEVFAELSPSAAPNVIDATRRLSPVQDCAREEAGEAGPSSRPIAAGLSESLARVKALIDAGEFARAQPAADQALAMARRAQSARGRAAAELAAAWVKANTGDFAEAEDHLHRALLHAEELGADDLRTDALTLLTFVVGYGQARHDLGLRYGSWAHVAAARIDAPAVRRAQILRYRGLVLHEAGVFDAAATAHHDALDTLAAADLHQHPEAAKAMVALANAHRALREFDLAEREYRRAIDLERDTVGHNHPRVANALHGLGDVVLDRHRPADALELFGQALQIHRRAFGDEHVDVAGDHLAMGLARIETGELEAADEHLAAALAVLDSVALREHPRRAVALSTVAHLRFLQNRRDEALGLEIQSLQLRRRVTPNHPDVAVSLHNVGINLLEVGRAAESVEYFADATEVARRLLGPGHPLVGATLAGWGRALWESGEPKAAGEKAEAALQVWKDQRPDPRDRFDARFTLARSLGEGGRQTARARDLAQLAVRAYAAVEGADPERLDDARRWLGERR